VSGLDWRFNDRDRAAGSVDDAFGDAAEQLAVLLGTVGRPDDDQPDILLFGVREYLLVGTAVTDGRLRRDAVCPVENRVDCLPTGPFERRLQPLPLRGCTARPPS
jgi:hypothetical protein